MKDKTYHAYLDSHERQLVIHSLVELKNRLIQEGRYDIMKHPNVRLTTDGGKPPYIHGEPTQAVATLVFDSDIPKNAVSVKAVSTSYELLSNEDLEEIFNI